MREETTIKPTREINISPTNNNFLFLKNLRTVPPQVLKEKQELDKLRSMRR